MQLWMCGIVNYSKIHSSNDFFLNKVPKRKLPTQTLAHFIWRDFKNPEMEVAVHVYISTETGLMKEIKQPCSLIIATISVAHVKVLSSHSRGFNVVCQIPANCPLKWENTPEMMRWVDEWITGKPVWYQSVKKMRWNHPELQMFPTKANLNCGC